METFDLCVIGAGPTGMACAIEAQLAGFRAVRACCAELTFTYEILGDPALRLSFVPTSSSFLPLVRR